LRASNYKINALQLRGHSLVSSLLFRCYGKLVALQLALCPTPYWNQRGAHFVVCKVAADHYSGQFFYSEASRSIFPKPAIQKCRTGIKTRRTIASASGFL
jgi:hypothetical protein